MERPKQRAVFAPRLLLIDGDPTDRAHSAQVLAALFPLARIKEVADELGFLASLEKDGYDVVVTELGLHDSHWLFLLGAIRATQPRAVTIVFTHRDDPDSIRSALRAGAADVVVKSSRGLLDLGQSIDGMLRNASERVGSFDDHEELGRSAPSGRSAPASRDREAASASSETVWRPVAAVPEPPAPPKSRPVTESEPEPPSSPPPESPAPDTPAPAPYEAWPTEVEIPPVGRQDFEPVLPETEAGALDAPEFEPPFRERGAAGFEPREIEPALPETAAPAPPETDREAEVATAPRSEASGDDAVDRAEPVAAGPPPYFALDPIEPPGVAAPKSLWARAVRGGRASLLAGVVAALALLAVFLVTLGQNDVPAVADEPAPRNPAVGYTAPAARTVTEAPAEPEPASPPTARAPAAPTAPLTLELRATDDVWIRLLLDGEQAANVTLRPGDRRVFEGETEALLTIGNAGGLTVYWNGQDLGSLGRIGQVRRLSLTPESVRPASAREPG